MKLRIFVDFWNFQLSFNKFAPQNSKPDWKKLFPWLITATSTCLAQPLSFEGATVYLSYDPRSEKDKSLRNWANNFLDRLPGIQVTALERKPKSSPICPTCHKPIDICPHCKTPIDAMIEKGVDTSIVTDLLSLAWEGSWEVAVLLSADRDFIPSVERLQDKGFKVINAHFPPLGMDLARSCWASLDLKTALPDITR